MNQFFNESFNRALDKFSPTVEGTELKHLSVEGLRQRNHEISRLGQLRDLFLVELELEASVRLYCTFLRQNLDGCNLAIYLADRSERQFNLAAYVNDSLPVEIAETVFDSAAYSIFRAFELSARDRVQPILVPQDQSWNAIFEGGSCNWLTSETGVIVPALDGNQIEAIAFAFRSGDAPFRPAELRMLETSQMIFCGQLSRIVHIHSRIKLI